MLHRWITSVTHDPMDLRLEHAIQGLPTARIPQHGQACCRASNQAKLGNAQLGRKTALHMCLQVDLQTSSLGKPCMTTESVIKWRRASYHQMEEALLLLVLLRRLVPLRLDLQWGFV